MKRIAWLTGATVLVLLFSGGAPAAGAALQEQQQQQQPTYTIPEYNAYQAAAQEQNPQQRLTLLDDFVAKFPQSTLMPYVDQLYLQSYNELQNQPKIIEAADKVLALGDKIDAQSRFRAIYLRTVAFHVTFSERDADAEQKAARARALAEEGIGFLQALPKPENSTEEQFQEQLRQPYALLYSTVGYAALVQKDYRAAVGALKTALGYNASDGINYFRQGLAYLQQEPPQQMDGFWALARSIALKGPGEAQVRSYLRNQLLRYQLASCDHLLDAQMNELVALAGTTAERPPNYHIPSAAELQQVREDSENFMADLRAGGERGKLRFLATCGLEFPEVVGKVLEVGQGNDSVILHVFTGTDPDIVEAAQAPNSEVRVVGQPEASRLEKDMYVRFSATLAGYEADPFLLRWDQATINPEDIPAERGQPGRRPGKRSGRQ